MIDAAETQFQHGLKENGGGTSNVFTCVAPRVTILLGSHGAVDCRMVTDGDHYRRDDCF